MNKLELTTFIAEEADLTQAQAKRALDAMTDVITSHLKQGGAVALTGFGTFSVTKRAARTGRNPRTGEAVEIKAAKVPKFTPGKTFKDALN